MDTTALRPVQRPLLHLALFVLTALTIFEAFVSSQTQGGWSRANVADALAFSLSLVAILGSHEMGHWVLARRHGVDASLPYFIPLPHFGFGTLGAVGQFWLDRLRLWRSPLFREKETPAT